MLPTLRLLLMACLPFARTSAAFLAVVLSSPVFAGGFRSIDGSGNNIANPNWGQAGIDFIRLTSNAYEDGVSIPRGNDPLTLPSARAVSNAVSGQSAPMANAAGASDWLWQWGQFLDHDLDLTPGSDPLESFSIHVPQGDPFFDPFNTGTQIINMRRSQGTGSPREQHNEITAYIDASMIYGSDQVRADALRTGHGMLTIATADNGEVLPMYNTPGLPNDGGTGDNLFLSGDFRVNEQIGLTAAHTLFVREHNRLAVELKSRLDGGESALVAKRDATIGYLFNGVDNESDFIYESVRKVVGAQIQKITYEEFLPLLLGPGMVAPGGYDDTVNASISNEFATAAYRVGHTMLSPTLMRVDTDGTGETDIALQDSFFNPGQVQAHGVDSVLLGLASQAAQEIDTLLVDDVRNFLFGPPGAGGFDLASLNIQRGRDHGLGSLNEVRTDLGLAPHADFLAMTGGDATLAAAFASVYGDVDEVDLWIGGLAEQEVNGGLVGETFAEILIDQFLRSALGDRFFYTNDLEHLRLLDPTFDSTLLSDILLRNTSIESIQADVFRIVPEPTGVALALACLGLAFGRRRR